MSMAFDTSFLLYSLPDQSLVPALDDLAGTQGEGERVTPRNAGVELSPVFQRTLERSLETNTFNC